MLKTGLNLYIWKSWKLESCLWKCQRYCSWIIHWWVECFWKYCFTSATTVHASGLSWLMSGIFRSFHTQNCAHHLRRSSVLYMHPLIYINPNKPFICCPDRIWDRSELIEKVVLLPIGDRSAAVLYIPPIKYGFQSFLSELRPLLHLFLRLGN